MSTSVHEKSARIHDFLTSKERPEGQLVSEDDPKFWRADAPQKRVEWRLPSPEDLEFWHGSPPEEIILATGSIRKALMLMQLLHGFAFTHFDQNSDGSDKLMDQPIDLQKYFDENIHNGDGHLKEGVKVFLGYFHGVPVYVENGNGETKNNNPIEQAEKKAVALAEKYKALNHNVLIISTDTVDKPSTSDEPLGKPMNEKQFKRLDVTTTPETYDEAVEKFKTKYAEELYPPGTILRHSNGVAIARTNGEDEPITLFSAETVLEIEVRDQIIKIFADCAGGGVFQQLIDWTEELERQVKADEVFELVKTKFRDRLQELDREKLEYKGDPKELKKINTEYQLVDSLRIAWTKWTLFCQISGMPWSFIDKNIKELIELQNNGAQSHEDFVELQPGKEVKVSRLRNANVAK